jgi:hypothetical protein
MPGTLYNYTYTNPSGYSYSGQVVADPSMPQYNYMPGQTYMAPNGGSYMVSAGDAIPTTSPSGAVYQDSYTSASGMSSPSYHYDPETATYYNVASGYNPSTGMIPAPSATGGGVPAWSGIGLGNEYSYVNTGTMAAPSYQTYGGGGTANVNPTPAPMTVYDYQFMYPDGSYYDGKVYDNGTYGYAVGKTYSMGTGTYSIYGTDSTPPAPTAKAGYNYTELYHSAMTDQNYAPSDLMPTSPTYQMPAGYGGLGTEKNYIQTSAGYQQFSDMTTASASTPVASIPLPT